MTVEAYVTRERLSFYEWRIYTDPDNSIRLTDEQMRSVVQQVSVLNPEVVSS